jgi:glutamate-1-semialdehyde 2,1-aminomutase
MAQIHLVGGISSAARALPGEALLISHASGPYLWDTEGQRYIDTALGFGGTILGHAPASVVEAVERALRNGPLPAFAHPAEEAAAAALAQHAGALERVVFTNSGSEAVHLACRIARVVTGRPRVAKIAAGYDGWYDEQALGNAGSAEARLTGNQRPDNGHMVLLRHNDLADTESLFTERDDIAAVLVEPLLANAGCIAAQPGYLEHLQATARRHGALLIADEVLMGFRLHPGLTAHAMGLDPDIATVGKAIGSGVAVAAVAGRPEVMAVLEGGRATRAGTYSGNPLACAAVLATLADLDGQDYPALLARGDALRRCIGVVFGDAGLSVSTSGYGSVFTLWPTPVMPRNYAEAVATVRSEFSESLHHAMRALGVLLMPMPFGRIYLSFAHDPACLDEMTAAFETAAAAMAQQAASRINPARTP